MKILMLEDNMGRVEVLRKFYPDLVHVSNVDDFVSQFNQGGWYIIFMDHDLDGRVYVPITDGNCGSEAIRRIDGFPNSTALFVLHSHNHDGVKNMEHALLAKGYINQVTIPFYALHSILDKAKLSLDSIIPSIGDDK